AAPAAGGTPGAGGQQAEIHVNFRQGSDAEWQQRLIPQFEAKNPGIKVILDVLPAEPEYWAKVQALYATGQVGDMIWASLGNFKNFADKGLLNNLDPIISKDRYDLKDYTAVSLETMKWNGKLYGMPWGAHTGNPAVMYNGDLLAQEGIKIEDAIKSYDSLYEAAVKLTKGNAGSRTQYGFLPSAGQIGMNNHIRAYGGDFYDQKGEKLTLDQAPAQDAIKWMQKMWRETAPTFGTGFNGDELFSSGRIALYQTGWTGQFVPGDAQLAGKFAWNLVQMPKGPKGIVGTQLTVNGITMAASTKQPDATWVYIKYMMDPEVQVQLVLNNGGRPAPRDAVLKHPELLSKLKAPNVYIPLYETSLGWPEPANHRWPEFNAAVDQVFGPIWTGASSLEAGMRDVNSKLQEILSKPKA
ncbi:MAG: sugar ABC transporter substrate-binding protein, partial [Chloroflexota bacterium]|nr:sugar ABC transporter substrate-binding protein [Chloroflexota bacterium]